MLGLVVPDGSPTSARPAEEKVEARVPYGEDVDKVGDGYGVDRHRSFDGRRDRPLLVIVMKV